MPAHLAGGRKLSFCVLRKPFGRHGIFGYAIVRAGAQFLGELGAGFVECTAGFVGDSGWVSPALDIGDEGVTDGASVDGRPAAFGGGDIVAGRKGAFEFFRRQSDHATADGAGTGRQQEGHDWGRG